MKMQLEPAEHPLVLALDTSTASLAAAVMRGDRALGAVQSMAERNHSVQTVPQIKALLAECGVLPEALDGIAIGRGPGSYTGMRIAVTIGKTLAWAWNKPLVGVSSLEALAFGAYMDGVAASTDTDAEPAGKAVQEPASPETDWFVPIMDARRGQVYTALFAATNGGGWKRLAEDGIRLMHDWVDRLNELLLKRTPDSELAPAAQSGGCGSADKQQQAAPSPARIWIVGDLSLHEAEAARLRELCETGGSAAGAARVRLVPYEMDGRAVARLGAMRLAGGECDDVHSFLPNYTQLAEAEVKLLAKQAEKAKEGNGL